MVRENDGAAGLQVGILDGNVGSEVQLQVTTRDGSATGETIEHNYLLFKRIKFYFTKNNFLISNISPYYYIPYYFSYLYFSPCTAPGDYSAVIEVVVFRQNGEFGNVAVPIIDDGVSEPVENLFADLALITDTDRVTVAPAEATITIIDNDGE